MSKNFGKLPKILRDHTYGYGWLLTALLLNVGVHSTQELILVRVGVGFSAYLLVRAKGFREINLLGWLIGLALLIAQEHTPQNVFMAFALVAVVDVAASRLRLTKRQVPQRNRRNRHRNHGRRRRQRIPARFI
ncbi:hypothetical protein KC571_02430 [candidate division WWE3 bacterium]|uniref:Uncharacterized protein n=1 Tax=candidate division WWE3 bacterium TaxID=2053526 RepID=A0A955RQ94_UNCKA|nr:hypothetical protein [candidate division WWE3 bacterium]